MRQHDLKCGEGGGVRTQPRTMSVMTQHMKAHTRPGIAGRHKSCGKAESSRHDRWGFQFSPSLQFTDRREDTRTGKRGVGDLPCSSPSSKGRKQQPSL